MPYAYEQMKLIFEHEKRKIMTTYELILDETTNNIQYINDKFETTAYPREIAKRFGFDYVCELKKEDHKYG